MPRIPRVRPLPDIVTTQRSIERAVDEEMHFHLQMRVEDLMRQGNSRDDAEATARREYGDITAAREELARIDSRTARGGARREWFSSVAQDVLFGLRGLRSRPGFTLTILLTLALGIGANAAIFSVVNAVLLRPLPFTRPDRLVTVWESFQSKTESRSEASYPDYLDWRARTKTLSDLGGYHGAGFVFGGSQPATVVGAKVTANFFDVVGVHPIVGRGFTAGEDAIGAPVVVMLTYGFWQREFGGDRSIVGKSITLNGAQATVVGVLPDGFQLAGRIAGAQLITPIDRNKSFRENRGNHWINIVARMRDGAMIQNVRQDMSSVMTDLAREYPSTNTGRDAQIVPLHEEMVGSVKPILMLLYSAVLVVLLVACVNVANLLLMRGADRQREIAVRIALGAGKARIVRQLLTESVMLGVCGGLLGLGVAKVGVRSLLSMIPAAQATANPALAASGLDPRVVGYALLISLLAGIAFGIVPALRMTNAALGGVLKSAARGAIGGGSRLRDALVIAELALTVVLMSGALLFGRSLVRLLAIEPGFRAGQIVTSAVVLAPSKYPDAQSQIAFFQRYLDRLRELPGVSSVGMVSQLPLIYGNTMGFRIASLPMPAPGENPGANYRVASPDYFRTMGIPVVAGRAISTSDDAGAPEIAVVNRAFVKAYLGSANPLSQVLLTRSDTIAVVGVVGDVPIGNIDDPVPPTIYFSFPRNPGTAMSVVVRTGLGATQVAGAMRQTLSSVDPTAALTPAVNMGDMIVQSPSVFMRRFPLYLVGSFALAALLLAIVGIYGVVSYSVAQRGREMGIRMALGAEPGNLVGLVVRHGGSMAAVGIVLGIGSALVLGRFAEQLLYGVHANDPVTYVTVAAVLSIVAIGATIIPARRATRVDPARALQAD
jgi:putative ABC transport system permease protein